MCGKNHKKQACENGPYWSDTSGLQSVDLVVVGVEDEAEPTSVILHRLLEEGQNVPMKLENLETPPWFDADKFKRGQRYFFKNYYAMFVTKLSGLLLVLAIPSVLRILILTGKSSTPPKAFRRYMDTISNMLDWYSGDLNKKNSSIYRVLVSVRGKHCAAAKKSVTNGKGIISQRDLALTQFGFMGLAVLKKKVFGMIGSTEDVEGFIHFWRTIGYFMGVEDRFNICSGSVNQVTEICEKLAENFFKPLLQKPNEEFLSMANALLTGIKPVIPLYHEDGFMEFLRRTLNMQPETLTSMHARVIVSVLTFIHSVVFTVWWIAFIFRPVLNGLLKLSIFANTRKYPLLAMLTLGKEVCLNQHLEIQKENHNNNTIGMAMAH